MGEAFRFVSSESISSASNDVSNEREQSLAVHCIVVYYAERYITGAVAAWHKRWQGSAAAAAMALQPPPRRSDLFDFAPDLSKKPFFQQTE